MSTKQPAKRRSTRATEAPIADETTPERPEAVEKVEARYIGTQTLYLPSEQRIIGYGDTYLVTPEQLEGDPALQPPDAPFKQSEGD